MRYFLAVVYLYLLFIVQAGILPAGPDFLLLVLIVFALHEGKLASALLGLFAGVCLDLTTPRYLGANMLVFTAIGYGVASVKGLFYRPRWYIVVLTIIALTLKNLIRLIAGLGFPQTAPLIISLALTLILSPFAEYLVNPLFYPDSNRPPRGAEWRPE